MVDMNRTDEDRAERRPSGQVSDGVACVCGHSANYHRVPVLGRCFLCSCSWYTIPSRVTSDAPLPPPDVQRPTPPLTEAELAHLDQMVERFPDHHILPVAVSRMRRLIADLRAARERVKELEAKLAWVDERIDSGEL